MRLAPHTVGAMVDRAAGTEDREVRAADRAVGAVVGSAVGDALGAYYEMTYPERGEEIAMRGGGSLHPPRRPGRWTDDTSMALGVLDVLASGSTDAVAIAANFLSWQQAGPPDIGRQTLEVLTAARGSPRRLTAAAAAFQRRNPTAAGNGALMRTAPVALGELGDRRALARLAARVASLTHPHADSTDACVLWSLAIREAIVGADPAEAFDWEASVRKGLAHLPDSRRRSRWDRLIAEAVGARGAADARHAFSPNGWVVTAFQAALWAIVHTAVPAGDPAGHFRDALVAAVRVGDDTDTVAAIAGGLLGARWGLSAMPGEWTGVLHGDRRRGDAVSGRELADLARQALG